ncbi:probable esterase PIR7A [Phoenix dactylifera]|uniref:Probable esterase PIR7A n=1 Tax=Phoenix dactylifera TaxID=42345 RepID=A0A8B7CIT1_PHODC|nr:probable esterase PIR7A [Phoenix dactylifera]
MSVECAAMVHFILVHGMCHGAWCWYQLATLLRSAGHRVTALDLAASGINPKRLDELRRFADYTEPLMEVMASIPLDEKVALVGHSLGGFNLALAMEKFPEKIAVAVFASAWMPSISTPMSVFMQEYSRRNPPGPMDSKIIVSEDPENPFTSFLFGPKYMATTMYQLSPPKDLTLATMLVRPGRQFLDEITREDMITEKNYGSVSRVFIVSKEDGSLMPDFQYWMTERSPGVEVKEIEGADHMVMLSKAKELCNVLLGIAKKY